MPLSEQELLTFLSLAPLYWCGTTWEIWSSFVFLLTILLSVLRFTASDYPFNIYKLFLENITITNPLTLSLSLFFFTLLCPATSHKFSLFTQAFVYPLPEIVKTLLDAVPKWSIPDKCTISPSPLKQVRVITYQIRISTL